MRGAAPLGKAAVVLGAQHPTGLLTARALRNCGLKMVGFHFSDSPCLGSNVWDALVSVEKSAADILEKLDLLQAEGERELLLLPADDECVKILSDNREKLPDGAVLPLPDADTVDLLLDKSKFYRWARQRGFHVPATQEARSFAELDAAISQMQYPLLIKPLYRRSAWDTAFPADKVLRLEHEEGRRALPPHLFEVASPILVQQWIPGTDADIYFCLVQYGRDGRLRNYFCGRKLMQWPPLGGSTAIAVSDDGEETRDLTVQIFDSLGYRGLASMEYKKDPRDGLFYIMEPTVGRNDFQSQIAVTAGVNLTEGVCRETLGEGVATWSRKRSAVWFCEPSVWYALKHYLRNRDYYFLKHLRQMLRKPGFAYLSPQDVTPFLGLLKSRIRWPGVKGRFRAS